MRTTNTKATVDFNKLVAALKARGFTDIKKAGPEMGYSVGWHTGIRRSGTASMPLLTALKLRFNIEYDEIKPDEPKPEPKPVPEQMTMATQPINCSVNITPAVISEALINVMMNQDVRNQLVQIIYYAVNKAMRNNVK